MLSRRRTRCALVVDAVSARADGERTGLAPRRVAAHLRSCAACAAFDAAVTSGGGRWARATGRVRLQPRRPVPSGLVDAARSTSGGRQPLTGPRWASPPRLALPGWSWLAATVPAVVAVVGAGTLVMGPGDVRHAPTRPPSPCTALLRAGTAPPVGAGLPPVRGPHPGDG